MTRRPSALVPLLLVAALVGALLAAYRIWWHAGGQALVVYCAHDAVFAGAVLDEFTRRTGIPVSVRYDSEATKSLGLLERIIQEGDHPQCDVLWNNEALGTMDLESRGLLAGYLGPGWKRQPLAFKSAQGMWAGFAARLRVLIVNTTRLQPDQDAVRQRLAGELSRVAIAKPLYGTTLTHYSTLWSVFGGERLQAWHGDCRARGIREVDGNGMVKVLVAAGTCDLGFTDTDDYFEAVDDKKSVAMLPARLGDVIPGAGEGTILIPNTVAIMQGAAHRQAAEALVDFLLSSDAELMLARSASRQIPLGPIGDAALPDEVRRLLPFAAQAAPVANLLAARTPCLAWLKKLYAP
jgi:iron(III) transport system substrate-binding protein